MFADEAEGVFAAPGGVFGFGEGAFADDGGHGEVGEVGHRDFEAAEVDFGGAFCTAAVEEDEWFAAAVGEDFDVFPADAADAGSEGFHDGFFGGEADGQFGDAAAAVGEFVGGVDAVEEAFAVATDDVGDAVGFDDVDAVGEFAGGSVGLVLGHGPFCGGRVVGYEADRTRGWRFVREWGVWPAVGFPATLRLMPARLIDGAAIAASIREEVAQEAAALRAAGVTPGLAAIIVGDNAASISYVSMKTKACSEVGIFSETFRLPATASEDEVVGLVRRLNADDRFHAILPQLPLPPQVKEVAVIDALAPEKDADGLHPVNLGKLLRGELDGAIPCTPHGVVELLLRTGNDPAGKHVVVVGRSTLVGRPLAVLLSNKARGGNATVTICHTATPDLAEHTRRADIVVVAAGRAGTLTKEMVKPGAVVIDVGVNRVEAPERPSGYRLVGDVALDVREVASWVTPYTGGVGPMTVAMLLVNTVKAARRALERRG